MLNYELQNLKKEIIGFANFVENMIEKSLKGITSKKREILFEIIQEDEPKANQTELEIDELCTELIAKFEPKAGALRKLLMVLKMNTELERAGDLAVNICESGLALIKKPDLAQAPDFPVIYHEPLSMFKDSVTAFIEEDTKLAKEICMRDDIVDEKNNDIFKQMVYLMKDDPGSVKRSMHIIRISKNLERVADLATNIAEEVIYMVEGKVIKHQGDG